MVYNRKVSEKRRRERNTKWLKNYKQKTGCKLCGYKEHSEILVTHHKELVKRKSNETRGGFEGIRGQWSIQKIKEELKKYLILCPNCHAWVHYQDNQFSY